MVDAHTTGDIRELRGHAVHGARDFAMSDVWDHDQAATFVETLFARHHGEAGATHDRQAGLVAGFEIDDVECRRHARAPAGDGRGRRAEPAVPLPLPSIGS